MTRKKNAEAILATNGPIIVQVAMFIKKEIVMIGGVITPLVSPPQKQKVSLWKTVVRLAVKTENVLLSRLANVLSAHVAMGVITSLQLQFAKQK